MRLQVGAWTVHEEANLLERGAVREKLERRTMAVLVHLAKRAGEVVSKDELINQVWNGQAVSDHSVAIAISDLRRALGDDRNAPTYIETIPKRGYRLIAPVERPEEAGPQREWGPEPTPGPLWQRLPAVALAVVALIVLIGLMSGQVRRTAAGPPASVVIADFQNASGREDLNYVTHAVDEMLTISLLDRLGAGIVRWRDEGLPGGESARLLKAKQAKGGAARIVTGRLILDGEELLLAVQLSDVGSDTVLWGKSYPLRPDSFVPTAKEIARELAELLGAPPLEGEQASASPEVYELYWRARYLWSRREHESIRQAIELLTRVETLDPNFGPAHAALADIYAHKTAEELGLERADTFAEAERHLERARTLSPGSSEIGVTEAILSFYRDRDAATAVAHVDRALRANPHNALAWQTRAMILSAIGQPEECLAAIQKAQALDPLSPSILWDKVWFLYIANKPQDALRAAEAARRVSAPIQLYYALIYGALGDDRRALEAWVARARERGLAADKAQQVLHAAQTGIANAYAALLRITAADPKYEEFDLPRAILTLQAGDREGAIRILEGADPRHNNWWWSWLNEIPALAPVRDDPRVSSIVTSLGFTS